MIEEKTDLTKIEKCYLIEEFYFDLQLFSAEDEGRTEDASERRKKDAREKGQVAKTQELPQTLVVICGMLVLYFGSSWIFQNIADFMTHYLAGFSQVNFTSNSFRLELFKMIFFTGKLLLPIMGGAMVAAILGNVAQVGFMLTAHPLKPDISKLKFDPATIMKKIFFSKQVAMNLFKSLFKVLAVGLMAYLLIKNDFDLLIKTADVSIYESLVIMAKSAFKLILWSSVLLLALSIPDYFFQRKELNESLKMTKQETKEEFKQDYGDPHVKGRIKQMQEDLLTKNMINEVPTADVVVTNPTHFAVALRYDRDAMAAPIIVAKGVDALALKIKEIARENDIIMIENRPLAHELYYNLDVGDIIPEELFGAVTVIYAEVYRRKNVRTAI